VVVNFRAREISQDEHKLAQIPMLIQKKKTLFENIMKHTRTNKVLDNNEKHGESVTLLPLYLDMSLH
jgi:hypothetical protein